MAAYSRGVVPHVEYRDDAGEVISYGSRWSDGWPPEDSYGRVSNSQRFEPLQGVARRLIAHLVREYEVDAASDPSFVSDFSQPSGVGEVVRLVPSVPLAARLTFGFTTLPGVFIAAGTLHQFAFPACGCDACDEDVTAQIDQLEETVFAVVEGDYREWVSGDDVGFSLRYRGGSSSAMGSSRDFEPERLAAGRAGLPSEGASWVPWPRRR
ncbi:hypothetical protein BH10ACT4_BH10ACT4_05870 [soil metagenome]